MKEQNYFAKGNQGNMEIEDGLKKIKSRQLGRCVKQLQLANAPQIYIDNVEKYFNFFYLDSVDFISSLEKKGNSGTYDNSNTTR